VLNNGKVKMFLGSFTYSADAKGRVAIPAKLRKYLKPEANNTFVLTRGTEKYIDLYPMDFWKELVEEKLNSLNQFDPQQMRFLRMFLMEAEEQTLDSQSRILIPKKLLNYAGIEKEVLILGAMNKIEIWNPETYKKYLEESDISYEQIAAEVMSNSGKNP
jgi:MraZ protein